MAAFDGGLRQRRQMAYHRQAGFLFQHRGQQVVQIFAAIIEQNAR